MVQEKMNLYLSLPIYNLVSIVLFAILLNRLSFSQSAKTVLVCNIFIIIALFLLVYVRFYTKNGGRLIYCIAQYKHFLNCCLDYLCFSKCLKIAWLVNQTNFTSTFETISCTLFDEVI